MKREEIQQVNEDQIKLILDKSPRLHQAIAYKYLHALGWRISDVEAAIREEIKKMENAEKARPF